MPYLKMDSADLPKVARKLAASGARLVLPVRDIRVLYALKARHYKGFVESQVPYPHEYFMPMEALIAENSHQNPALQTLLARASASANFLEVS